MKACDQLAHGGETRSLEHHPQGRHGAQAASSIEIASSLFCGLATIGRHVGKGLLGSARLHPIPRAAAEPVGLDHDFEPLDLSPLSHGKDILLTPAGVQHVLLREDCRESADRRFRCLRSPPVAAIFDATVPLRHLKFQVAALQFLMTSMVAAALAAACLPPEPRGGRLRIVLQALDGSLAGASQEIAIALFGRRRVEKIGLVRAAIFAIRCAAPSKRGRYLIGGGYRQSLV
ncbi:DNA -binding domain-containing protein [Mesorhizobium shangrilense]|uniref:DUF2285 domain-containing protein n=1 Tax=Mesorhizobium shangrilense TaxID=460060 RepID=A0ABV2DMN5_9HYPH